MVVPRGRPRRRVPPIVIAVCWKWVAADGDERWAGVSDADRAALEIGLRLAEATDDGVTVVTRRRAGCRRRAARGAGRRRHAGPCASTPPTGWPARPSPRALAGVVAGADVGGVRRRVGRPGQRRRCPAFLAAELGAAQALGLVDVDAAGRRGTASAVRPGASTAAAGRCSTSPRPAVLSVEGAVADGCGGRRCPAELAARTAPIEVVAGPDRTGRAGADVVRPTARGRASWPRPRAARSTASCSSPTPVAADRPTHELRDARRRHAAAERILADAAPSGATTCPVAQPAR